MTPETQTKLNINLTDIRFLHLAEAFETKDASFTFDTSIPLPVQMPETSEEIAGDTGVSIAQIASGIIKILAYDPGNANKTYYKELLLALQPDIVHELQLAGAAKGDHGEIDFAIELYLAAVQLNPMIPELYVNLATLYSRQAKSAQDREETEKYDEWIRKQLDILKKGLGHLPSSPLLLSEYGLVHLFLGNDEIALEHLTQYLSSAPEGEKKGIIEKQVSSLRQQVEDEKTIQQAFDEMQIGNEEQALILIDAFLEHNDGNWSGHFIRGWALRRTGRFEEGEQAFLKCLSLGANSPDIYNELSICALETGKRELSMNYLEIALELEENSITYITNLALLYMQDEMYNEAAELVIRGRSIDPEDPVLASLVRDLSARAGIELTTGEGDIIDG